MTKTNLFFATNRKHEGDDRWNPSGYGTKFSRDGDQNLRFGELALEFDPQTVQKHLDRKFDNNSIGDGEELSKYFSEQSTTIRAYEDLTAEAKKEIKSDKNASTHFFHKLKKVMMESTDVVIYVHGYNVSWNEAVGGALSLQYMLNSQQKNTDKKILVVLFSWPSNGSMMPYAAYISDRTDARASGLAMGRAMLKLKDFLATLHNDAKEKKEKLCKQNIHLLCHSMGNYLLQKSLENKLIGYNGGSILPRMFKHIFLCSADVKDDVLEGNIGMARVHEMASNVTIYYNQGDLAMNISKYTKNISERLGHVGNAHPALVHNKVHQVDCSPVVHGKVEHSYYLWGSVNKDIAQSIAGLSFDHEDRNRKRNGQNREWAMV